MTALIQLPSAPHAQPMTATNAKPLTAIAAFRQDACTKQDSLLPEDWPTPALKWCHEHVHDFAPIGHDKDISQ